MGLILNDLSLGHQLRGLQLQKDSAPVMGGEWNWIDGQLNGWEQVFPTVEVQDRVKLNSEPYFGHYGLGLLAGHESTARAMLMTPGSMELWNNGVKAVETSDNTYNSFDCIILDLHSYWNNCYAQVDYVKYTPG